MQSQDIRHFVTGSSAANLALAGFWGLLFQHANPDAFYLMLTRRDILAALLNLLLVGGASVLLARLVERTPRRWLAHALRSLAMVSTLFVANVLRQVLHLTPPFAGQWMSALGPRGLLAGGIVLGVAGMLLWPRVSASAVRLIGAIYLILSPFLIVTVPRSIWIAFTGNLDRRFGPMPVAPALPARPGGTRVVVVVFDELDYRLAFVDRPPGVDLPEFDRLRATSLSAEQAVPPAGNTNESLPSLLTGERIEQTVGAGSREGHLRLQADRSWRSTDSILTLFERARAQGVTSAMVGWNLPYCRTGLGRGLTGCLWAPSGEVLGLEESLVKTMWHQWVAASPVNSRITYRRRLEVLWDRGLSWAVDPAFSLVVLHLPVPHYPWLYDRQRQVFSVMQYGSAGYFGNLALADRKLGELRIAIQGSEAAGQTTLIVTSDHPWRESRSYDQRQDPRVPFLVQLAGHREARVISQSLNTIVTGALTLDILGGRLRDPDEIPAWLAAHSGSE